MTNKEIEQAEKDLSEIEANPDVGPRRTAAINLAKELRVSLYDSHKPGTNAPTPVIVENIYRFLQTKMMFNACVSARSSCKWAAIAAIVASLGVLASWHAYLFKMIILMIKGI